MSDAETDWYAPELATFGDRVSGAREAVSMTQRELAHRLGVRVETLQSWEDDRAEPRANRLQMLAGLLNVSMRWLLTGEGAELDRPQPPAAPDAQILLNEVRDLRVHMTQAGERLALVEKRLKHLLAADGQT